MAAVGADGGLGEETKALLLPLYQQAADDMKQASTYAERAVAFEAEAQAAPEQLRFFREQIETNAPVRSADVPGVTLDTPLDRLQEHLNQTTAELMAAKSRRSGIEQRLVEAQGRPPLIRERLDAVEQEQEELAAVRTDAVAPDDQPEMSEARQWGREARSAALVAELHLLQQELLSQPLRLDLLEAKLGKENAEIEEIEHRVAALRDMLHAKRRSEADAAQTETEKVRHETAGLHPVLDKLAAQNVELTQTLKAQAAELAQLSIQRIQAEKLQKRIEADLKDLQGALQTYGRIEGFGSLLLRQHESLPDIRLYKRRAHAREQQFAELGVRRLDLRDETRRIADLDQTVAAFEALMPTVKAGDLRGPLVGLLENRHALLAQALEADEFYLAELNALETAEHDLLKVAQTCDEFLEENLLWLRSAKPIRWTDLTGLPKEIRRLLDPALWSEMWRTFRREAVPAPLFWIVLVLVVVSVAKRKAVTTHIQGYAELLGSPLNVRFSYTLRALAETLVAALPWPLLLAALGWSLRWATPTSTLSYDTGRIFLRLASHLYLLRVLSLMCLPRGLAEAHFRWPESDVSLLRVALGRLTWVYIPTVFLIGFAIHLAPAEAGGTLARLGLVIWSSAFALFFYHLFHSRRKWLAQRSKAPDAGFLLRVYPLWCTLFMLVPLGLVVLTLTGYVYSATDLAKMFVQTLGMVAVLIVLHQLAMRSLRIVRRRLAYAAAVERRQSALKARELEGDAEETDGLLSVEEPEVDLEALSDDTGDLVNLAAIAAGLAGLYVIWDEMVPALRILNEVAIGGTTLGNVALALLAVVFTTVLARRLPSVLEIFLLRFSDQPAGTRHATTTLCTYAIVTLGTLFALNAIGLRWSQFQWLIAALGVGIGFGLQEVVANFICGLIILFERPIRVGDVVTVGDTDGMVTRIRIRATTICNWDRKELLVPNKEFITGRLLNWSLSDQIIRILVKVGVAYGSDTDTALALMREAATEHEDVLSDPVPIVSFDEFGDSSLNLTLRVYLSQIDRRILITTDLHRAIDRKFRKAGIVIAFPQRDVHLDISEPLRFSEGKGEDAVTSKRNETP